MKGVRVDPENRAVDVAGRLRLGRRRPRHPRVRYGHPQRDHLHHRRRRPHPWRRAGPPDPQVRPGDRQPARGGRGPGRRPHGQGQRRRAPRPALGAARRRRQLRRRHLVPLPAAPDRHRVRRPDVLAARADRRGHALLRRFHRAAPTATSTASSPSSPCRRWIRSRRSSRCRRSAAWSGATPGRRRRPTRCSRRSSEFGPPLLARLRCRCRTRRCSRCSTTSIPTGHQWYWRADFVNELSDEAIAAHAEHGAKLPTMHSTMHLYPIDGAAHDVGAGRDRVGLPGTRAGAR